jgi:predicted aspartyl protease
MIEVGALQGARFEPLEALVDTGASHLVVPRPILESLGVQAVARQLFSLADGRTVDCEVGNVLLRIAAQTFAVACVFGDAQGRALLGASAMETFLLAPDPVHRRLVSVPGLLLGMT